MVLCWVKSKETNAILYFHAWCCAGFNQKKQMLFNSAMNGVVWGLIKRNKCYSLPTAMHGVGLGS